MGMMQPNIPNPMQGEQSQIDPSSLPASPQQPQSKGFLPPELDPMQNPSLLQQGQGQMPMPEAPPDPVEALPMVILDYLDFATETRNDKALGAPVRATVMLQIAQAINYLVPLLPVQDETKQQDMQLKVAEFQMNAQEREQELQLRQQEHQMDMQMKQEELQFKQQEAQMKLQQSAQEHQQKLVQNEQMNEQKVEQAKQAAQVKPSSSLTNKPTNKPQK